MKCLFQYTLAYMEFEKTCLSGFFNKTWVFPIFPNPGEIQLETPEKTQPRGSRFARNQISPI